MRLRLQVRQTAEKSFPWEHKGTFLHIGRDPGCELSLQGDGSQSVSWHHARVELTTQGAYLNDLGSSNGTFVNGKRAAGRARLQIGDLVELGRTGPKLQVAELDLAGAPLKADAATAFERLPADPHAVVAAAAGGAAGPARPVVAAASRRGPTDSGPGGGTTRMLLVKLQTSQHRNMLLLGIAVASIAALLLIIFGVLVAVGVIALQSKKPEIAQADPSRDAPQAALTPSEIYQQTLHSTVWIVVPQKDGMSFGSGSLIDRDRKLIITAQHVVGGQDKAAVFFPYYENGKAVEKKEFYRSNAQRLGIEGRVLTRDVRRDLALIELDSIPDEVPVLRISEKQPEPGHCLYTVGNPGLFDTAMWQLTTGTVRQVTRKQWRYQDGVEREADVLETQSPTNPGDSGGPVVNSEGELVAVVSGARQGVNLMTFFVDRGEILKFLAENSARR
jgi:hypothetical protein